MNKIWIIIKDGRVISVYTDNNIPPYYKAFPHKIVEYTVDDAMYEFIKDKNKNYDFDAVVNVVSKFMQL